MQNTENKKLEDVPSKQSIFVDTNILIYHLVEDELYGGSCREFPKRIEGKDIIGFISPLVIIDPNLMEIASDYFSEAEKNIRAPGVMRKSVKKLAP